MVLHLSVAFAFAKMLSAGEAKYQCAGTVVAADLVNFPAAGPTWSVAGGVFYCAVLLNTLVCFGGGVAYRTARYQSDLVDEKRICLLSCRKDTKTSDAVSRWKDSA